MDIERLKQTILRLEKKSDEIVKGKPHSTAKHISSSLLNNISLSIEESPTKESIKLAQKDIHLLNFYIKLLEQSPQIRKRELSDKVFLGNGVIDIHGHLRELKGKYSIGYS